MKWLLWSIHQVYPDIENIEDQIPDSHYSEIFIAYSADEFIQTLKKQFGERMDSLNIEGISAIWQIKS